METDFTPTVGLGCRSGGYMVYFTIAFSSFSLEMLIWWLMPVANSTTWRFQRLGSKNVLPHFLPNLQQRQDRAYSGRWSWMTATKPYFRRISSYLKGLISRGLIQQILFRFLDVVNSIWLAFVVCAQTLGADQNCDCSSANWGPSYVRFETSALAFSFLTDSFAKGYVQLRHYGYYRGSGEKNLSTMNRELTLSFQIQVLNTTGDLALACP